MSGKGKLIQLGEIQENGASCTGTIDASNGSGSEMSSATNQNLMGSTIKSDITVDLSPENRLDQDRVHLLRIFPQELWLKVFDAAKDPNDLERLNNSSPYLRQLLLPTRTEFLFENMWKVFNEKQNHNMSTLFGSQEYALKLPLNLRAVCHSWNKVVDNHFQNQPLYHQLKSKLHSTENYNRSSDMHQTFSSKNRYSQFLNHFDATHGGTSKNPFIGRTIKLHFTGFHRHRFFMEMYASANNFLSKYGLHIWYCSVAFSSLNDSTVERYIQLRKVLQLMPNLKVLRISTGLADLSARELTQLQAALRLSPAPLPTLDKLQVLNTDWQLITPIFNELIRTNGHVTHLHVIRNQYYENYNIYIIYNVPLPNLRILSLENCSRVDFKSMASLPLNWSLTDISLSFRPGVFIEWQQIFSMLNSKWGNTLSSLELTLPESSVEEETQRIYNYCPNFFLNLAHLNHLKLELRDVSSVDFLLPLSTCLTTFNLTVRMSIDKVAKLAHLGMVEFENNSVIRLLSCIEHPLDSNIWIHFPKLMRIEFVGLLSTQNSGSVDKEFIRFVVHRKDLKLTGLPSPSQAGNGSYFCRKTSADELPMTYAQCLWRS